ncbi:response regulator transcription factor [Aequorivita sp. H23M31]|uniref:Response regulator transcription factor n=1 Tax=Aequorivita ciconiae TaxID=2494375 RepID=A0A410FZM4_9FLAO|nr:LytTR family DNA-binding domain-containing protein [Aequorivita sp. H23M31]QAA80449.1 response regulator transcription factor [Aequorivita sp. H23M31]
MDYNYIIVEDNPSCIENLRIALKSYNGFSEVGTASTLSQGISLALTAKPHLIFLDVQLGDEIGFDLIKEIRKNATDFPFFIMTTDFDKYGKEATNNDALYFLDKPIDPDELSKALYKFENRVLELQDHITIKNSKGHFFIDLSTIQYIKSSNNYCIIYRMDENPMIVSRTLKNLEVSLPSTFLRIHKSYIVNRNLVQMINTRTKIVRLNFKDKRTNNELELPIGNSYLDNARRILLDY